MSFTMAAASMKRLAPPPGWLNGNIAVPRSMLSSAIAVIISVDRVEITRTSVPLEMLTVEVAGMP